MVDVHAAHLEEADGAPRVSHHREHRPRIAASRRGRKRHQVARAPAQERRHGVRPQRGDDERADLAFLDRLTPLVEHLEVPQVGERMQSLVPEAFAGDDRRIRHAAVIEHLGAPGALELLALHRR